MNSKIYPQLNLKDEPDQSVILYDLFRAVSGQTDLCGITQAAVDYIATQFNWPDILIALPDNDRNYWTVQAASGRLSETMGQMFPIEQGIVGQVFKTAQYQYIPNMNLAPNEPLSHSTTLSQLAIPLQHRQHTLGVLNLQCDQINAFDNHNMQVAVSLAEIVALALNNVHLHLETQTQASNLSTLYTVTRMANRSLLLEDVLSHALNSVLMLLDFDAGLISLLDPIDDQLQIAVEQGLPSILSRGNQREELEDTLYTYVYKQRQHLVFEGYQKEIPADISHLVFKLINIGLRAYVCIPLVHQEQVFGVLGLFAHQPRSFSKNSITLLNTIGEQIATAVANARLFQSTAKFKSIVNASGEMMSLIGQGYTYELVNDAYCLAQNKMLTEIVGKSVDEIWGEHIFNKIIKPQLDTCFNGQEVRYQAWFELHAQGYRHLDVIYSPYYDDGEVTHVVVVSRDVTERKQIEDQLFHQASHDTLTNLPNRTLFMERLEQAIVQSQWNESYLFAVLFIDLDRFKNINDSLGHLVGDQLLIAIARRLETYIRPSDTVARLGGDEFIILLNNLHDIDEAQQVAERIKNGLAIPITLNEHIIFTTASIGITANTRKYDRPEDLLRDADTAMYQAKSTGKARHALFETGQHTQAMLRWQLESDLWQAVKRKEFQIYYQPFVSLISGKITGVEALLRWQHPREGLLDPEKFISLAEETGLIVSIGEWLLRMACTQAQIWRTNHPNLTVAVNMSARQIQQPNLLSLIKNILNESGLPAQALEVEITESVRTRDIDLTILSKLRELGIKISIDDFGIGSSLECLKQIPLTTLKIDQSFVKGMMTDVADKAIITTIITMAHSLDLQVIAEGVETKEQLNFLMRQKCDQVQGYLFSKPIASEAVTRLLQQHEGLP